MFVFVTVKILIIQSALLGVIFVDQDLSLFFNFSEFTDSNSGQILYINSYPVFGAIQVTPDLSRELASTNVAGRAFFKHRYNLWNDESVLASFNTTFVLNIQNITSRGGEGLAFVLAAETTLPDFSSGSWLGIVNSDSNGSPQAQIVAIEFDTRKSYDKDLDDNHVGLDINSIVSRSQFSLTPFGVNLLSGNDVKITVRYDGQSKNLSLYLAQMASPVFNENIDLSVYLPQKVFVGFSASTSDETQLNCIRSWEFNGTYIRVDDKKKLKWVWIVVPLLGVFLLFAVAVAVSMYSNRKLEADEKYPSIEVIQTEGDGFNLKSTKEEFSS